MNIKHLPTGTKLMWDPKASNPITNKVILYPATVGEKHDRQPWRMVYTGNNRSWMQFDQDHLREATPEEVVNLKWPLTSAQQPVQVRGNAPRDRNNLGGTGHGDDSFSDAGDGL